MTTGARIVVTQAAVEAALAEWHIERTAAELKHSSEVVEKSRASTYTRPPHDYAHEMAPYVFSLLVKHGEGPAK